jgi:hypothetical protein
MSAVETCSDIPRFCAGATIIRKVSCAASGGGNGAALAFFVFPFLVVPLETASAGAVFSPGRRLVGMGIERLPPSYGPVTERGCLAIWR